MHTALMQVLHFSYSSHYWLPAPPTARSTKGQPPLGGDDRDPSCRDGFRPGWVITRRCSRSLVVPYPIHIVTLQSLLCDIHAYTHAIQLCASVASRKLFPLLFYVQYRYNSRGGPSFRSCPTTCTNLYTHTHLPLQIQESSRHHFVAGTERSKTIKEHIADQG